MDYRRLEKIKRILQRRQPDLTLITDNVNNFRNLSSIIRSCEAVGIMEVHLVNNQQEKLYLINKVTAGAERWLTQTRHSSIVTGINHLKKKGFTIYATHLGDPEGICCAVRTLDYRKMDYTKPTAFVVGSEKKGISEEALENADYHISIPMMGMTQSLNVSVATAIILFEAQRQREEKGYYQQLRMSQEIYEKTIFEWAYPEAALAYRANKKPYPPLTETGEIKRDYKSSKASS
ncbi:TrmH family RNA methyltransferase [Cyanobacterium aponinum]|uniref:TrmH family RNA methyltransferase n=1 Tax=Cyanobacterium aponinum TaxID=379064 RepID=UPI000C12CEAD|nr:TrmH family RNA methyltransferase [Cyanobacterium aponinum]PHV63706.1 tRNA (guanine-N2)-dimethyltransferase [Cyanobacterium aponinum IPPAS B-1201]